MVDHITDFTIIGLSQFLYILLQFEIIWVRDGYAMRQRHIFFTILVL